MKCFPHLPKEEGNPVGCCLSVLPQEMEKLAVVWHSQRVLTASAPGKEKKAEAENNTRRTQVLQVFQNVLESSCLCRKAEF